MNKIVIGLIAVLFILFLFVSIRMNNNIHQAELLLVKIETRLEIQQEAVSKGVAYYHPQTGAFTWKTIPQETK